MWVKEIFLFAPAGQINRLMSEFEKNVLKPFTPCRFKTTEAIIKALAVVHTELLLIHPFREGNGRIARLIAMIMALQAGLPLLDFGGIKGRKKQEYFASVQAGLEKNYRPMERIFYSVVKRSIKKMKRS